MERGCMFGRRLYRTSTRHTLYASSLEFMASMICRKPYDMSNIQRLSYNRMFILVEVQQLLHYLEFLPQSQYDQTELVSYIPTTTYTTPQKKPRDGSADTVAIGPDDADSVFSTQFVALVCPHLQRVVDTLASQRTGGPIPFLNIDHDELH